MVKKLKLRESVGYIESRDDLLKIEVTPKLSALKMFVETLFEYVIDSYDDFRNLQVTRVLTNNQYSPTVYVYLNCKTVYTNKTKNVKLFCNLIIGDELMLRIASYDDDIDITITIEYDGDIIYPDKPVYELLKTIFKSYI